MPAGLAPGSFLPAGHRSLQSRACYRRRWPCWIPSLGCAASLPTARWRDCVTALLPCQTRRGRSAMEKLPHPVVPPFAVDVRIGPRNDRPVTGGLIALLHDEVHEIGVQGVGAEPDHRADALAEIEARAYPPVPGVALRLGERDERLRHLHDGEAAAPPREDIGRIETGGSDAAFERHMLNGLRAIVDRKSTRLNSSHVRISYAVFCL